MRAPAAGLLLLALPGSSLAVWTGSRWEEWWRWERAPAAWEAPLPALAGRVGWRRAAAGVEWGELRISGPGVTRRIRVVVVRLDPARVRFRLETAFAEGRGRGSWTVDQAPEGALAAINAGQFAGAEPWGWLVVDGREYRRPGTGPLSVAIAFDTAGAVRWIPPDSIRDVRGRPVVAAAFQSYPRLLDRGAIPEAIRREGLGVDLRHRDARAAFGQARDGRVLLAITRFDGAGGVLDFVPFGLTVPEMAAVMGGLGARDAVMLDGGISSQLLVRDGRRMRKWRGLREVPVGLVVGPPAQKPALPDGPGSLDLPLATPPIGPSAPPARSRSGTPAGRAP
jgi:hypothetical protein